MYNDDYECFVGVFRDVYEKNEKKVGYFCFQSDKG